MKKTCTIVLILILALFALTVSAQKIKNKKVKTSFTLYPAISLNSINSYHLQIYPGAVNITQNNLYVKKGVMSKLEEAQDKINKAGPPKFFTYKTINNVATGQDVNIEIAFGKFEIINKKQAEHKIMCKYKGADASKKKSYVECPAYYYELKYKFPVILRITDKTGSVLYAEKQKSEGYTKFGYQQNSGFIHIDELKAAYAKAGNNNNIGLNALKERLDNFAVPVNNILFFHTLDKKYKVFTGSGDYDYTTLENAQQTAVSGYESIKKGSDGSGDLKKAIEVWEKEVTKLDKNNKKAEINYKIAMGLRRNLATAYTSFHNFDKALENIEEALTLQQNVANTTDKPVMLQTRKNLKYLKKVNKSYVDNKPNGEETEVDLILHQMNVKANKAAYNYIGSGDKYEEFKLDYIKYSGEEEKKVTDPKKNLSDLLTGGKSYKDRIMAYGDTKQLICNDIYGDKFEAVPDEICALTELTQLNITDQKKLTALSSCIGNLTNLKKLNLWLNALTTLPPEIGKLANLEALDISNNKITSLPVELKNCKKLKRIKIKGNSIKNLSEIKSLMPNCKIK